ncbi:sodium- and chloride-dependent GABA transporter 2-like [Exaiptasia diaphana]|uniref:Transporter n=1 Tax=Exaiptasia diaphana TaxID=2652724 RepID=A0A913YJ20_EXADI|nr:sodium- and chloride-dependent GABA transporter 2-like [Exaiptasia diaphana]
MQVHPAGVEEAEPKREEWAHKADFLLSCIGYAVGLGNIWRFPYLCYRNGGASFLIPYIIMLLLCGIPLFYMELALGQYFTRGALQLWKKICPISKGIGIAMLVISSLISTYYNIIIAWSFLYLFNSIKGNIPFNSCDNSWNTILCLEPGGDSVARCIRLGLPKNCKLTTPSEEYWKNFILAMTSGMEVVGEVRQPLALSLFLAWLIVFLCVVYGIKSSGKVAYFSATFPYVILVILIVRGATLPGAYKGVIFYLKPDFTRLLHPQAWVDAASQIFFSLSCGLGGLIVFGSYNKFNNNCQRDAITVSVINCWTSFFGGFAIFTVLGFVSETLDKDVQDVISSGPGLAFVVYPESIAQMPVSPLWAVLFFVMLFLLGIDSQGGIYVFNILDRQSGGFSLIFVSIFESVVVAWCYVSPLVVTLIFVWSLISWKGLEYEGYKYPFSGELIGWGLCLVSILCIPGFAFWHITRLPGSLKSRIKQGFTSPASTKDLDQTFSAYTKIKACIINMPTKLDHVPTSSIGETYSTEKAKIEIPPKRVKSEPLDFRKAALLHSMKIHIESLV